MKALSKELSTDEQTQLTTHETTINAGLQTFHEVGNALLAIREARLYRQDFATFEDYCRQRATSRVGFCRQVRAGSGRQANDYRAAHKESGLHG